MNNPRCSLTVMAMPHSAHGWQIQPGMDVIQCPGVPALGHPGEEQTASRCGCPCQGCHQHCSAYQEVTP